MNLAFLKFIYSEEATKFWEIFTLLLSYVVPVKSRVKISQNFVAFSEYMNFNFTIILSYAEKYEGWDGDGHETVEGVSSLFL